MSSPIVKVAVFGASGNFGAPITSALVSAGFSVTIVTRAESTSAFPDAVRTVRTSAGKGYSDVAELTDLLRGQDAVVSALGPPAVPFQAGLVEAAERAGVARFVLDDFGWGPDFRGLPEFDPIKHARSAPFAKAEELAQRNGLFTWTGVCIGNPIDWALKRFPAMGFDIANRTATIYDSGTEQFTGTTLEGIGRAVVGVLRRPGETANRFVKVRSIKTSQSELLTAFQQADGGGAQQQQQWTVRHDTTAAVLERGRRKHAAGEAGWILDLVVAQLFEEGEARSVLAATREESDCDLLGVRDESAQEVVAKALGA